MKSTEVCELRLEPGDEIEHLGLDGRVEAGRRLVEDQERRIVRERHRDDHPLLHPAGELMGIARAAPSPGRRSARAPAPRGARSSDSLCAGAADPEDLGDLLADRERRVQRGARVLVDHRDGVRAEPAELAPGASASTSWPSIAIPPQRTRPFRGRYWTIASAAVDFPQPDSPTSPYASPRSTVSVKPRSTWRSRPRTSVDDVEIVAARARAGPAGGGLGGAHRSSTCWRPSATRLTPTIRVAIASEGKSTVH